VFLPNQGTEEQLAQEGRGQGDKGTRRGQGDKGTRGQKWGSGGEKKSDKISNRNYLNR
jgi:hypothetical protein